jgi:hypothetical protein
MNIRLTVFSLCFAFAQFALAQPVEIATDVPASLPSIANVVGLTDPPKHHFVGYYGITPWNAAGTRLANLEADFGDRLVRAGDVAAICLVDPFSKVSTPIAKTAAWNLQQGAMLHWLPTAPDREIIYNDRIDGRLVSVILDVESNARRVIQRPIAAISPDGKIAIGINYDRLRQIRPVTGYAGGSPTEKLMNRPTHDGLSLIDLVTGESRPLVSVETACNVVPPPARIADQPFWLEHALFSRGKGDRLFFLARAFDPKSTQLMSIPLVMTLAGGKVKSIAPWGIQGASHYDWLDNRQLVLTREQASGKWQHVLIDTDDVTKQKVLAKDVLTRDGHCSFSPDGKWMITDTYPDNDKRQHLFIYDVHHDKAARLGSFRAAPELRGDWRCDLHPRWDRDSRRICIDSAHEDGTRQVYIIDLNMPRP